MPLFWKPPIYVINILYSSPHNTSTKHIPSSAIVFTFNQSLCPESVLRLYSYICATLPSSTQDLGLGGLRHPSTIQVYTSSIVEFPVPSVKSRAHHYVQVLLFSLSCIFGCFILFEFWFLVLLLIDFCWRCVFWLILLLGFCFLVLFPNFGYCTNSVLSFISKVSWVIYLSRDFF